MKVYIDKRIAPTLYRDITDECLVIHTTFIDLIVPKLLLFIDRIIFRNYQRAPRNAASIKGIESNPRELVIVSSDKFDMRLESPLEFQDLVGPIHEVKFKVQISSGERSHSIESSVRSHYSIVLTFARIARTVLRLHRPCNHQLWSPELIISSQIVGRDSKDFEGKLSGYFLAMMIRLWEKLGKRELWGLGYGVYSDGSLVTEALILPKKNDRIWADPHVVIRDGEYYIFVEEMLKTSTKGIIVCLHFSHDLKFLSRSECLEECFHLSYPQIIETEGETYMIPETSESRSIRFYRCVEFPNRWEFSHEIMKGRYCVDSTFFQYGEYWYMITTIENDKIDGLGNNSWLFSADTLLSVNWREVRVPFSFSVSNSRSAGPIFELEGNYFRPVQDGSRRYGYAVNLNRINSLNTNYIEQEIDSKINPPRFALGLHTFCYVGPLVFFDFIYRPKMCNGSVTNPPNIKEIRI